MRDGWSNSSQMKIYQIYYETNILRASKLKAQRTSVLSDGKIRATTVNYSYNEDLLAE